MGHFRVSKSVYYFHNQVFGGGCVDAAFLSENEKSANYINTQPINYFIAKA